MIINADNDYGDDHYDNDDDGVYYGTIDDGITISAIACERFLAINWPFRYKVWVTPAKVRLVLLICIGYPTILLAPLLATRNTWQATLPCVVILVFPPWFMDLIVGNATSCIVIMMITYIQIIKILMRLQRQVGVSFLLIYVVYEF